jgi:hypothetical protein
VTGVRGRPSEWIGRAVVVLATTAAVAACPKVPVQTGAMESAPNIIVSADQLQLQAYELGRQMSARIVVAADSVLAATTDLAVRRHAIEWKVTGVPLAQEAAVRNDPLVAAVDLAAFSVQQQDFFTTGAGKDLFGPQQRMAVDATARMRDDALALLRRASRGGELNPQAVDRIAAWARAHPIAGPDFQRASILDSDWQAIGVSTGSLAGTVGNMDRTLRLVQLRLGYINETMGDQMRWNAQLIGFDALESSRGDSLYVAGSTALRNVGAFTGGAPDLIAHERAALLAGVDRERVAALAEVDRQRVETLRELDRQRDSIFALVERERARLMDDVRGERVAAVAAADSITARAIDHAAAALVRAVWKLGVAVLGLALLITFIAFYARRRWRVRMAQ